MKTKKEIAIKLTNKNRKKVQGILEMFGEKPHNPVAFRNNYLYFDRLGFYDTAQYKDGAFTSGKDYIKPRDLRSILAAEKLKAGDYVIIRMGLKGVIKEIRNDNEFCIVDRENDKVWCFISEFKRYATQEEIDLLEGKEVDKFAELKEAHKNGAVIEVKIQGGWHDELDPNWNPNYEYRIKPEDKPKVGDVVKLNSSQIARIQNSQEAYSWRFCTKLTQQEVIDLLFKDKTHE